MSQEPDRNSSAEASRSWNSYWESVQDRTRLFETEADDYVSRLLSSVQVRPAGTILDFGCGFGHTARSLSPHAGRIVLYDRSVPVMEEALRNTAHLPNVHHADPGAPLPAVDGGFNLIIVHSVVQYMSQEEILEWLRRWSALLAPDGRLVLSDLVQPGGSFLLELAQLLKYSVRRRIVLDAAVQTFGEFATYWRVRKTAELTTVTLEQLEQWGQSVGLSCRPAKSNLSFRWRRLTAILHKPE